MKDTMCQQTNMSLLSSMTGGLRRHCMCLWALLLTVTCVNSQLSFVSMPDVPPVLQQEAQTAGVESFVKLWNFAMEVDGIGSGPAVRINFEPKTIFGPSEFAFMHLIPQDIAHPLYLRDEEHSNLRQNFILSHLVLDPVDPQDPRIATPKGLTVQTFSGDNLTISRDEQGDLIAGNKDDMVAVRKVTALDDGSFVYELQTTLFDLKSKVRNTILRGFEDELAGPLGPPLDIPTFSSGVFPRAPAPPPNHLLSGPPAEPIYLEDGTIVFPPAPPPEDVLIRSPQGPPRAPALPPASPPAAPPAAPPAFPSRTVLQSFRQPPASPLAGPPALPPGAESENILNGVDFAQVRQEQRSGRKA